MYQIFNLQTPISFIKLGVILVTVTTLITSCKPSLYQDISNTVPQQFLSVQQGDYTSVAWIDKDHIAFIYRDSARFFL